ncbi:MAG: metallophosphoesterase [Deltaproteobacteria bacterium]|nr:metallophosphoesterase [Deltaproteobacteria bacterium]
MFAFPLFWTAVTFIAWFLMRRSLPAARTRSFTVVCGVAAGVSLVPWAAVMALGWDAFDRVPPWSWSAAIAVNLGMLFVIVGWPVWGTAAVLWERRQRAREPDPARRALLARAGALVPGASFAVSSGGVAAATLEPVVNRVVMHWPDLPPALEGFRIGQLTDVHVGPFVGPEHVVAAVTALNRENVDLVVMTGDLVDDVSLMPGVNAAFAGVRARHGIMGVLGNHEHYAGLREYRDYVRQGPMRLLVDEGTTVEHGGARIHVGGVDYPFRRMDGPPEAARASMVKAMAGAEGADFRLCLAHHPTCWDEARRHGAHLTLAGHTHGGQVAVGGRSIFAGAFRYILGRYEQGASRLYVSSGTGHWFPFRLGCPAEVVVVELRRGPVGTVA